jgi:putative transcriptional regulator
MLHMPLETMSEMGSRGFLDGQLLVAMPSMPDARFARSVIYVCAHSPEGAMGLVINQPAPNIEFPHLLEQLEIISSASEIRLPQQVEKVRVLKGGPVETGRGFVLHSSDFFIDRSTLPIDDGVCLTATVDILKAMASGSGPRRAVLALGYAGWGAGQLETEIHENGWLHCQPDQDLLFDQRFDTKYDRALRKIGIDPAMLSSEAGHA